MPLGVHLERVLSVSSAIFRLFLCLCISSSRIDVMCFFRVMISLNYFVLLHPIINCLLPIFSEFVDLWYVEFLVEVACQHEGLCLIFWNSSVIWSWQKMYAILKSGQSNSLTFWTFVKATPGSLFKSPSTKLQWFVVSFQGRFWGFLAGGCNSLVLIRAFFLCSAVALLKCYTSSLPFRFLHLASASAGLPAVGGSLAPVLQLAPLSLSSSF